MAGSTLTTGLNAPSPGRRSPKPRSGLWNFRRAGRTLEETRPFIPARCARASNERSCLRGPVYIWTATAREEEERDVATSEPSPQGIGAPWRTVLSPFRRYGPLQAPKLSFLLAVGVAGIAAALATVALGLTNDELSDVGIRAFLNDWLTINFIFAGLVAWWRRPDSRFGPLMVAAGFANFLSTLSWSTADLPFTVGFALGLLPPLLFLYVFLAYPSGRLLGRLERRIVAAAYVTVIGLDVVRMLLGGAGTHNLLQVVSAPRAVEAVRDVEYIGLSAFCVAGIGVLAARRWGAHRLPRRPLAPLVDSFALGLVMIAALFSSIVFVGSPADVPAIETLRRATFFLVGLAPLAFLLGLLRSRLAIGPTIVSLGTDIARGASRMRSGLHCATPLSRSLIGFRSTRGMPISTVDRWS